MKQTMVLSLNACFVNTAKQLKSAVSSYEIKNCAFYRTVHVFASYKRKNIYILILYLTILSYI